MQTAMIKLGKLGGNMLSALRNEFGGHAVKKA